jgi:hypothetical protein
MKTIKVETPNKVKDARIIGKPIEIYGQKFACVDYPEQYMNLEEPLYLKRVVHVASGLKLGIDTSQKAPAKQHLADVVSFLTNLGEEMVLAEISKYPIINNLTATND